MAALISRAFANTGIEVEVYNSVAAARAAISQVYLVARVRALLRRPAIPLAPAELPEELTD
jgi:hypothetical protein